MFPNKYRINLLAKCFLQAKLGRTGNAKGFKIMELRGKMIVFMSILNIKVWMGLFILLFFGKVQVNETLAA